MTKSLSHRPGFSQFRRIITGILTMFALAAVGGPGFAADTAALIKDANAAIREGEKNAFAGKAEEARTHLKKALDLIEQIKAADPANAQLKTLERKCKSMEDVIARKEGKSAAPAAAAPAGAPAPAAGAAPAVAKEAKIPAAVTHRLKTASAALEKARRVLGEGSANLSDDYRTKSAEAAIKEARETLDAAVQSYAGQVSNDTPEVKAVADEIAAVEKQLRDFAQGRAEGKAKEAAQKAAVEGDSAAWVAKLKPYVYKPGLGAGQPKALIDSATRDKAEMDKRMAIYGEASAVFAEYQKAGFASGKSEELQKLEEDLGRALKQFADSWAEYAAQDVVDIQKQLADVDAFITREEAKKGGAEKPVLLQKDMLADISRKIDSLAGISKKDDTKVSGLRSKLDAVKQRDARMRADRVADTTMTPDKYSGPDAEQIRKKAGEFVNKAFSDAKLLRATVISGDWKEESVIEPTDSTNTALRFRTTRSVTAQVGAKRGSDCFLYTVDVSKDKRTDGTWGELYGHVMFTDPILEANVTK